MKTQAMRVSNSNGVNSNAAEVVSLVSTEIVSNSNGVNSNDIDSFVDRFLIWFQTPTE